MLRRSLTGALLAIVLWAPSESARGVGLKAEKEQPSASTFLPGGVVDAEGKTGYLANPAGGIDAIDLSTGRLRWSSPKASKPLALAANRLAAQATIKGKANQLRVVVLDVAHQGKLLATSTPVVFPDWVSIGVTYGRSFTASGKVVKGQLFLRWEARAWYAGGARPTPEIERRARKHDAGVARIDLKTGKVALLKKDQFPKAEGPKLLKALANVKSLQYWTGTSWETKPLVVGNRVVALAQENEKGEQVIKYRRWDLKTAKAKGGTVLLRGKALWPMISGDRRSLFIHKALPKTALPKGDYAWWVFALASGKQVAKIPFEPGTRQITRVGPRAYYVIEISKGGPRGFTRSRTLKAIDLKSGKEIWKRAVWAPPALMPLP
jgi:hypothetical protein